MKKRSTKTVDHIATNMHRSAVNKNGQLPNILWVVSLKWSRRGQPSKRGPDGTGNKVHFSGFEEWIIGEDGLIAQSDGNFDNDEYQHQLAHGIDF